MAAFIIATDVRLTGKFLVIIFIFRVIDSQLNIMQPLNFAGHSVPVKDVHIAGAGECSRRLACHKTRIWFYVPDRLFFLYALFQYRIIRQFFRHIIESAEPNAAISLRPLILARWVKVALTDGARAIDNNPFPWLQKA